MKKYKIMDKKSSYIDSNVILGEGVVIGPNVSLRGKTIIGDNTVIDQNTIIVDSVIGNNNYIASSVIEKNNLIGDNNKIGPFTHLKEDNTIGEYNEIGSYVEMKSSSIGNNNKMKHLAYIGNVEIDDNVNIGAGVVFANYNSKTEVKAECKVLDNASIGSNCTIVAPVTVGKNSLIGAGSVVRHDIEDDSLYFTESSEIYKKGYYQGDKDDS